MGCSENPWNTVPLRISFVSWSCSKRDWKMARRGAHYYGDPKHYMLRVSVVHLCRQAPHQ